MEWNDRYLEGNLPWETGREDFNLVKTLTEFGIKPCDVLELGCGTGNNAIWLARNGYKVMAVDLSEEAIRRASQKISEAGVPVSMACLDIMRDPLPEGPFGLVFDRGCFHSFDELEDRRMLSEKVHRSMSDGAYWLSLIGSSDGPPRDMGPPQLSVLDVASSVEQYFEIISLVSSVLDSDHDVQPRSWNCLMRKRTL